jgi:hypothetical protein
LSSTNCSSTLDTRLRNPPAWFLNLGYIILGIFPSVNTFLWIFLSLCIISVYY